MDLSSVSTCEISSQAQAQVRVKLSSHSETSRGEFGMRKRSNVGDDLVRFKMACESSLLNSRRFPLATYAQA